MHTQQQARLTSRMASPPRPAPRPIATLNLESNKSNDIDMFYYFKSAWCWLSVFYTSVSLNIKYISFICFGETCSYSITSQPPMLIHQRCKPSESDTFLKLHLFPTSYCGNTIAIFWSCSYALRSRNIALSQYAVRYFSGRVSMP